MRTNLNVTGLTAQISNTVNNINTQPVVTNPQMPFVMRGVPTWQGQNSQSLVRDGFVNNATAYSIIKVIYEKAKVPVWGVYKVKDKGKAKKYKALAANKENWADDKRAKLLKLKEEAFEPYTGDARLNELLKYPNEEDTFADLIEKVCMFKLITGNSFTYAEMIGEGSVNVGKPLALYALPSQYMSVVVDLETFPVRKTGYQFYFTQYQDFDLKEIIHDKYANPEWNLTGNDLYGLSPLRTAAMDLTRDNQSNVAVVSAYANEAPIGVLAPKAGQIGQGGWDTQGAKDSMEKLKSDVAGRSGSRNRGKMGFAGMEMVWTAIGFSPEDMEFIEGQKWNKEKLCGVYGVPPPLIGSMDAATYNNMATYTKMLILNCVIPLLSTYRDNFNRQMQQRWGYPEDILIDYDLSCFSELEVNRKDQRDWMNKTPMTLREQYRQMDMSEEGVSPELLDTVLFDGKPVDAFTEIPEENPALGE